MSQDNIDDLPEFIPEDHITTITMLKGYVAAFLAEDVTLEELKLGLESALRAKVFRYTEDM